MKTIQVVFRGNRKQARTAILKVYNDMVNGVGKHKLRLASNVAASFFKTVHDDFVGLSQGKPMHGEKWEPNRPRTLAYSKGNPNERMGIGQMPYNLPGGPLGNRQGLGRGHGTGMLSEKQLTAWWFTYWIRKKDYLKSGKDHATAKERAAMDAYGHLRKNGGYDTLLSFYGKRPHKILVESGDLMNSFVPSVEPSTSLQSYRKKKNQVFDVGVRSIRAGTSIRYAKYHHNSDGTFTSKGIKVVGGVSSKRRGRSGASMQVSDTSQVGEGEELGLPRRRLWPDKRLPQEWKEGISKGVTMAVEGSITRLQKGMIE